MRLKDILVRKLQSIEAMDKHTTVSFDRASLNKNYKQKVNPNVIQPVNSANQTRTGFRCTLCGVNGTHNSVDCYTQETEKDCSGNF
jgi:hypothetical protein